MDIIKDAMKPIQYYDSQGNLKTINTQALLAINENNLEYDLAPSYFLIARLEANARLMVKDLDNKLSAKHGELYAKYSVDSELRKMNNGKKPTENMINSAIECDDDYKQLNTEYIKADYRLRVFSYLLKALDTKVNLTQSLSARKRMEQQLSKNATQAF